MRAKAGRRLGVAVIAALVAACSDSPTEVLETSEFFSIALNASQFQADQGANVLVTATLTRRNGFTGPVTLVVERLPSGVTGETDVIEANEVLGRVTLRVATNTPVGTTRALVRASAAGAGSHTVPLTLVVKQPGGSTK